MTSMLSSIHPSEAASRVWRCMALVWCSQPKRLLDGVETVLMASMFVSLSLLEWFGQENPSALIHCLL